MTIFRPLSTSAILLFLCFASFGVLAFFPPPPIAASVVAPLADKTLECECYNATAPETCKNKRIQCEAAEHDKHNYCFVLWTTNNVTGAVAVSMKGCFTNNYVCNQTECIDNSLASKKNYNFCCCRGNMCNMAHKWVPTTAVSTTASWANGEHGQAPADGQPLDAGGASAPWSAATFTYVTLLCFAVTLGLTAAVIGVLYYTRRSTLFKEIPTDEPDANGSSLTLQSPRPVHLIEEKAHGRFGSVWRAQYRGDEVAVKVFPLSNKNSWQTEQEIFRLAHMKHPNILEYIGSEKRTGDQQPHQLLAHQPHSAMHPLSQSTLVQQMVSQTPATVFWLITSYHQLGSLCDYLKCNTVSWPQLCRIAESMARGLSHLHEELPATKTEGVKPAVAHRDFKSKNVLLKTDMTACIADFGLALIFEPGKPCGDAHGQVGTRRYMAPEVLEGAINFTRDAFLRIDVYACGLVIWELVSRCTAHEGVVGEYKLPFEAEIGLHTGVETMQEQVVTKKVRPKIQDVWRKHAGLNSICDTMEECWDHDAEARLSASCVVERIAQHTQQSPRQLVMRTNDV